MRLEDVRASPDPRSKRGRRIFLHGERAVSVVPLGPAIKHFTGGLGAVDDVVPTVEFLVKGGASWVSGQTLFVNGGFVAR
jgi:NAD(P)-dependent dehydrogenase (short-subunit alcohol dehydrogenase family)